MRLTELEKAVDAACEVELAGGQTQRRHLGASAASTCPREGWYTHRRYTKEEHFDGRMLRLFNRGHGEEDRVVRWLRAAGCEVRDYAERLVWHPGSESYAAVPWEQDLAIVDDLDDVSDSPHHIHLAAQRGVKLKQYRYEYLGGHSAGSSDGRLRLPEHLTHPMAKGWGGLEIKTHNDNNFKALVRKGVTKSKPKHYIQMTAYMRHLGLPWTLYVAVNKNDDKLYFELVRYKPEVSDFYADVTHGIIEQRHPPKRISENATAFGCKFCDFARYCHHSKQANVCCTTCVHAEAVTEGTGARWRCGRYHQIIPVEFEPQGCPQWEPPCEN